MVAPDAAEPSDLGEVIAGVTFSWSTNMPGMLKMAIV